MQFEKIEHYQKGPKLLDRAAFFDECQPIFKLPVILKEGREFERLACLQHLNKRAKKQKQPKPVVVTIKAPKNWIKRIAHHQHQPIQR